MPATFDALLRNARVVDPLNGVDGVRDLAIRDGAIVAVEETVAGRATREHDLTGKVVIPGIIDLHVHLSPWLGGTCGHRMLALAGVTTALDLAGPIDGVVEIAAAHGAGLTIACIDHLRPGRNVGSVDPSSDELTDALARARRGGAIGLKLLGGHFPLTAASSGRAIAVAAGQGAYVAFHAGTLETPSTIDGMQEACELAAGRPLHMAHVNSYVRGQTGSAVEEGERALAVLAEHPNVWSESYLAPFNGVSAKCSDGAPDSLAARNSLKRGGFAPTTEGMIDAIRAGWAMIHQEADGVVRLVNGTEALAVWRAHDSDIGASFPSNPPEPRLRLVTATKSDGSFAIDALATDGGGIPRNDIIERGLPLVRLDALDLRGFVTKTSVTPARMLGLAAKGHLGVGADGDVTVLDMDRLAPVLAYANGRLIMADGHIYGEGGRMITTAEGERRVREVGLEPLVVEPGSMLPPR
ncbi:MAG: amidohydrolase [Pseudomonadota bacterium]